MLLLAPLLAEAVPVPRAVSRPTGSAGAQGTDALCTHFRWMAEHAPVFRVPGSHVHVLRSPEQFYQAMKVSAGVCWLRPSQFGLFSHPFAVTKDAGSVFPEGARCWCHLMSLTSRQQLPAQLRDLSLLHFYLPANSILLLLHDFLVSLFLAQSGNVASPTAHSSSLRVICRLRESSFSPRKKLLLPL